MLQSYDKENKKPVIKSSICNGEQVTGFKDIHTGKIPTLKTIDIELPHVVTNAIEILHQLTVCHIFTSNLDVNPPEALPSYLYECPLKPVTCSPLQMLDLITGFLFSLS